MDKKEKTMVAELITEHEDLQKAASVAVEKISGYQLFVEKVAEGLAQSINYLEEVGFNTDNKEELLKEAMVSPHKIIPGLVIQIVKTASQKDDVEQVGTVADAKTDNRDPFEVLATEGPNAALKLM